MANSLSADWLKDNEPHSPSMTRHQELDSLRLQKPGLKKIIYLEDLPIIFYFPFMHYSAAALLLEILSKLW